MRQRANGSQRLNQKVRRAAAAGVLTTLTAAGRSLAADERRQTTPHRARGDTAIRNQPTTGFSGIQARSATRPPTSLHVSCWLYAVLFIDAATANSSSRT